MNLQAILACGLLGAACVSTELPVDPPPLVAMEEPLERMGEPQDEAERAALPTGSFTGIEVGDSRASLDALLAEPEGVLVTAVVENSPGDAAGVEVGDLLLEARAAEQVALHWPSDWRRLELESEPGTRVALVIDRAGAERELTLVTQARVRPAGREPAQRFREEDHVGVVLRTATEVEARRAALGPGGGAVVVGLSRESPWRNAGIVYGDLVRAVDGVEVAHPEVVLEAIRSAEPESELELELIRDGQVVGLKVPVSRRAQELHEISIPLLFSYEKSRDRSVTSVLLGAFKRERTPAAWKVRVLWLFSFSGGDSDRLESVDS